MPRQDVPYGGAICRLKERIAEIWDKLDQKLHSINGVEGDGAGDVKIVSGDAGVVINNDQIGHRIEVSLDKSNLPAAAVSSVNGQTGAVRLDAADIPSDGNSNVQADIAANKATINECFDSIATEQDDRQAADAALQTNINAARASIPEMSTTPDPYKGVERDAQGRVFAADPAAGATDETLVTANWVSQTGEGRPNNVLHSNGAETKSGRLTMKTDRVDYGWAGIDMLKPTNYSTRGITQTEDVNNNIFYREELACATPGNSKVWMIHALDSDGNDVTASLMLTAFRDGTVRLQLVRPSGTVQIVPKGR